MNTQTYKIYSLTKLVDGKVERKEIRRFEAESNEQAISEVKKLREEKDDNGEYYWDYVIEHIQLDENGNEKHRAESIEELIFSNKLDETVWYRISIFISSWWGRFIDMLHSVKWAVQRVRTGYDDRCVFNLGDNIIDMLKVNVRRLRKNNHGCPNSYCLKAKKLLYPTLGDEELRETDYPHNKIVNIGAALWETRLEEIELACKLYDYYKNFGIVDSKDFDDYISNREYPIPFLYGTENRIDYEKLLKLEEEQKDKIMKYLAEDLENLYD